MKKKDVIGAIYPTNEEVLNTAIEKNKLVYVKNSFHDTPPLYLSKGSLLFFYVGKPHSKIMAKGVIKSIEVLSFKELIKKYSKNLMQNRKQLKSYCGSDFTNGSWKKHVYILKNLKQVIPNIESPFPITPTGRYLTKDEYKTLKNLNKSHPIWH